MKKGLVFGKFMPLHKGHLSLIKFASLNCDKLYVVLCYCSEEKIPGKLREQWLRSALKLNENISIISFQYDPQILPNTSVSSKRISQIWSSVFQKMIPDLDIVFTSEKYGDYVAKYLSIEHICFDEERSKNPISASAIRKNPFYYWDFIADEAKYFFVKKIAILGTESTGKSTLAEKLAKQFNTLYVNEAGREVVDKTQLCKLEDLYAIAELHAKKIDQRILKANKLLFIDTDLNITKSYSHFLFNHQLRVAAWIEEANVCDAYLFLENDAEYFQDGTRLPKDQRDFLDSVHKKILADNSIRYISINGKWNDRFSKACDIINQKYFSGDA